MQKPREPKRRNLAQTKTRILAAAADAFTEFGYARASLRDIAERAEVAPSLVSRHFGSKAALFEKALVHVIENNSVFTSDKVDFGSEMARLVNAAGNLNITISLVLALGDPESRAIATRVARERIIAPLADWLGPPNAYARAMNMFSLLTGFVIQMQGLRQGEVPDASLKWLSESLQALVEN